MNGESPPWTGRTVLVTGATGLVGSWVTKRLIDDGARVVAFIRDSDPQSELFRSATVQRVEVISGSLEDAKTVTRSVVGAEVDTIIHLGAQTIVGTALRNPTEAFEANIHGTWNVLEVARMYPDLVRTVVVASSDKAYGSVSTLPYTEDMALSAGGPYDVSKSCADLISQSYARTYGVPVAIARCGNVYGGGDLNWSRIVPGTLKSLRSGRTPVIRSDGSFKRDYIYIQDVVDAYLTLALAMESMSIRGEAFNFSAENPVSVMDIYKAVCDAAGMANVQPKVLSKAQHEIHDQYLSSAKAHSILGWKARYDLQTGLNATARWYGRFFDDQDRMLTDERR